MSGVFYISCGCPDRRTFVSFRIIPYLALDEWYLVIKCKRCRDREDCGAVRVLLIPRNLFWRRIRRAAPDMEIDMNERALRILEFPKIIEMLVSCAGSIPVRSKCQALVPSGDLKEVRRMQTETADALK